MAWKLPESCWKRKKKTERRKIWTRHDEKRRSCWIPEAAWWEITNFIFLHNARHLKPRVAALHADSRLYIFSGGVERSTWNAITIIFTRNLLDSGAASSTRKICSYFFLTSSLFSLSACLVFLEQWFLTDAPWYAGVPRYKVFHFYKRISLVSLRKYNILVKSIFLFSFILCNLRLKAIWEINFNKKYGHIFVVSFMISLILAFRKFFSLSQKCTMIFRKIAVLEHQIYLFQKWWTFVIYLDLFR